MNPKYSRILVVLIVVIILYKALRHYTFAGKKSVDQIIVTNELGENIEKVKVSVYYEALCPDSKFFITNELVPTYEKLKDFLLIDLVPYGKAETIEVDGKIDFHCQHDAIECFANKIHSCAIEQITDPELKLKYVGCMIDDNLIPQEAAERCGEELKIDYTSINKCATDVTGSQLLKKFGERTYALNPKVNFIPTIELNNSQNLESQPAILKDLFKAVCKVFIDIPMACKS